MRFKLSSVGYNLVIEHKQTVYNLFCVNKIIKNTTKQNLVIERLILELYSLIVFDSVDKLLKYLGDCSWQSKSVSQISQCNRSTFMHR